LALLTQSSLYSILLLPPFYLLGFSGAQSALKKPTGTVMKYKLSDGLPLMYLLCMLALMGISTLIAGNFRWINATWGATYVYSSVLSGFSVDMVLVV